ncbi:MAG TPA: flagellar biosynthetic protein FliO [Thermoleophilaceae bacterium]|jgi:flagellar protein FliO/FliZ|nr:flagellar biosynthetic protein FliO [Thermoleophilaceae bacterium]
MNSARFSFAAVAAFAGTLVLPVASAFAAKPSGPGENTPLNLPAQTTKAATGATGGGGSLVRTFVGLAIVLAVIYGVYWVLRQVKSSREERASGYGLASIATLPLGPNRSLHMVRSGREYVLVGASEHGVTPIRTYTEEEAKDAGLLDEHDPAGELMAPAPARTGKPNLVKDIVEEMRKRTVRK